MLDKNDVITRHAIAGKNSSARRITISGWSGRATYIYRHDVLSFITSTDQDDYPLSKVGVVYVLLDLSPIIDFSPKETLPKIYIGESENIEERIKRHLDLKNITTTLIIALVLYFLGSTFRINIQFP